MPPMIMASKLSILPSSRPPLPPLLRSHFSSRQNLSPGVRVFSPSSFSTTANSVAPLNNKSQSFLSPPSPPNLDRSVAASAGFQLIVNAPLISPHDQWGNWTALFAAGAFGIWAEKNTNIGGALSGALVSTLIGLAASNVGIMSSNAPAFSIVLEFLLPLAVPLLLYRADLRRVIKSTGQLLLAFLLGSVATTVGTVVAYLLVPMRSLGQDSWKIAAALMGRHIGGAVNYVAIADALGVSPSILTAGLAADNVICALYFSTLFALASRVPPEPPTSDDGIIAKDADSEPGNKLPLIPTATALAVSLAICKSGHYVTKYFGIQGGILPVVTAIVVTLATIFPTEFAYLAPSGEAMAMILMQVFFTVVGASGSIWSVINTAPSVFFFALIQIAVHLAVILGLGKLFGFDLKLLLIASNANVGGPTTACGMATAKEWKSMIVPGILAGIFGISIATFIGIGFAVTVLKFM